MIDAVGNKGVIYEFGAYVLDPNERTFFADGKPVHLPDKVFDTLLFLIQNNGRLLTKGEMMSALWTEAFVEEGNLAKNISRLRKMLHTDGVQLIETVPGRGYRFQADVKEIDADTSIVVRRDVRVRITHSVDDGAAALLTNERSVNGDGLRALNPSPSENRFRKWGLPVAAIGVVAIASSILVGVYLWRGNEGAAKSEPGPIRLTTDPKHDNRPVWTRDGRIRFFRSARGGQPESIVMQADGTNQTVVKDFADLGFGRWSPDEKKVFFVKPNDKTVSYLADADGSNEIALSFYSGNYDWSPDSKKIVYQQNVSVGDPDIFTYTLETGNSENITNLPTAFDAEHSFSPDGKQIVFVSLRDGNAELYLMNVDGSDVRRLTNHPAWDSHPVFSPDGTTIAFSSDQAAENSDVYMMNVDGSNVRRLTDWPTNEWVEPGCWSADGTQIAFTSDRYDGYEDIFVTSAEMFGARLILADDENDLSDPSYSPNGDHMIYQSNIPDKSGELRILDVQSGQTRSLLKTENTDTAPVFSPDGEWIAFQNKITGNTEICLIKTDGSDLTNLTNNTARDTGPAFSPDGKQIIFASNRDGNYGHYALFVMNADGSEQREIYSNVSGMSLSPVWMPDGREIVFANDKEDGKTGNFEIFKFALASARTETRLTFRPRPDGLHSVSPDGRHIVFVSTADGNPEIYLMDADGSNQRRITRNAAQDLYPNWSPDGKRLIFASDRSGRSAVYELTLPF
jgi:Tol biopolymer transport system component/DNA-binding winged helix-turn-helix (wHTH) protein